MSNLFVSLWFFILRTILYFLHIVYAGLQYFDLVWSLFKRRLDEVLHPQGLDEELYVSRFVTSLEKCPSHLAVIVGTNSVNVEDISNIVIWCLAAGISFLSFYDQTGSLKDRESKLYDYLISKGRIHPNSVILGSGAHKNGVHKNGVSKKIHLNFLSASDGKPAIVNVVKNLSRSVLSGELKSDQIVQRLIDGELHNISGLPDPDLGVIIGDTCSTYEFMPWQIQVTEFLRINSLHNIRMKEFVGWLRQYGNVNQRFGK